MKRISALLLALLLLLPACARREAQPEPEETDPHAGMVLVDTGAGESRWVTEYPELPVNELAAARFVPDGAFLRYTGAEVETLRGIDVSSHQGEIDWEAVKAAGVEFVMLRLGYRGYTEGGLYEDERFRANAEAAARAGLRLGAYFFSQATGPEEAREEAAFVLDLLDALPAGALTLPVAFDWERIDSEPARTDAMDGETLTDCALAFCGALSEAGYTPAVYAYRYLAYFMYDLGRLAGLTLWIGAPGAHPDFYYRHALWQYSETGSVPGIEGPVDLDMLFLYPEEEGE